MRIHVAFQLALTGMLLVPATTATASKKASEETHAQVVRLSLAEGDVRIARDEQQGQAKNTDWEKAITGLPLESGFSLATGSGRAVIEFQDASTLYLGENSVLVLNDLTATGNTPHTEVALLSGTVTLHVHPEMTGEQFLLRTPTDTMVIKNPDHSDLRVTAYMDAIAITPLSGEMVIPGKTGSISPAGKTVYYRAGSPANVTDKPDEAAMADWDKWVSDRYEQRVAAYASVMQETGIKTPVPGLDSLQGKGKFVDCGEYGKCWEPPQPTAEEIAAQQQANNQANGKAEGTAKGSALTASATEPESDSTGASSSQPTVIRKTSLAPAGGSPGGLGSMAALDYFPCGPDLFYYGPMYGYAGMMSRSAYAYTRMYDPYMWSWAVCNTGSWIYQQDRYLWVPGSGSQINYQPPVQWVKWDGKEGYVPIHPRDVAGQTPVNLQNGMIPTRNKNSLSTAPIKIDNAGSIKLLNSPPRAYRDGYSISLARSESPRMAGRILGAEGGQKAMLPGNSRSVGISFDHDSRSFMVARPVGGNSARTVNEPVGSFLVRSGVGGFGGPLSYHPGGEAGMRGHDAMNGGAGGRTGEFRGGAVFNGGTPRGGGGNMDGGAYGGFNRGPGSEPTMNGAYGGPGAGGGAGGGVHSGGGGGGFGGGPAGGGAMGGGHSGGGSPAPVQGPNSH
jgi:hypothetical protein